MSEAKSQKNGEEYVEDIQLIYRITPREHDANFENTFVIIR